MAELTKTMDQAACPVESDPERDSTGVKAMAGRPGKYLAFSLDETASEQAASIEKTASASEEMNARAE